MEDTVELELLDKIKEPFAEVGVDQVLVVLGRVDFDQLSESFN